MAANGYKVAVKALLTRAIRDVTKLQAGKSPGALLSKKRKENDEK